MPAFFFDFGQVLRNRRTAFDMDVNDLIRSYGASAYQVASRRRIEANALSSARYWTRVRREVGRRIRRGDLSETGFGAWCQLAKSRSEALGLAVSIERARWGGAENWRQTPLIEVISSVPSGFDARRLAAAAPLPALRPRSPLRVLA